MNSRTPDATLIYAIGDLHGRLDLLDDMHRRIESDAGRRSAPRKQVVYLGDYINRGADSPRVVDRVIEWLPEGFERVALKGNHEDLLHSITSAPEVRHNRIGIDTGAYRSGVLTCLVLDGERRSFLQTAIPD